MKAKIKNWEIVAGEGGSCFVGNVFGNPNIPNGERHKTEIVINVHCLEEAIVTRCGEYVLGNPSARYAKKYPHARERFLARFRELMTEVFVKLKKEQANAKGH